MGTLSRSGRLMIYVLVTLLFSRWRRRFAQRKRAAPRTLLVKMLLCLPLCASCAAPLSAPGPREACFIPRAQLNPTPVPPLKDETYGQVRQEADADRKMLLQCNSEKSTALQVLEKQNQQRKASETESRP